MYVDPCLKTGWDHYRRDDKLGYLRTDGVTVVIVSFTGTASVYMIRHPVFGLITTKRHSNAMVLMNWIDEKLPLSKEINVSRSL